MPMNLRLTRAAGKEAEGPRYLKKAEVSLE